MGAILLVVATVVVFVVTYFAGIPVRVFNDTATTVVIPDCGADLTRIDSGKTVEIEVARTTRMCTVDVSRDSKEVVFGCLVLPSPLRANVTLAVSKAQPTDEAHPCQ